MDVYNWFIFLGLITKETRGTQPFFKPVVMLPNVIELAYYSNSLVPHFALDSIMVTALHTLAKEHERNNPTDVSALTKRTATK